MRVVLSSSASVRLSAARQFISEAPPGAETLIVSASRGAADDFARACAVERSSTFGLYRFSLTQLAARLAAPLMADAQVTPSTALGIEAVAARAVYDASSDNRLRYFTPVADTPGFPRALARTLEELALAGVPASSLGRVSPGARDLAELLEHFESQFAAVSTLDRAAFLRLATEAAASPRSVYAGCRLVLLDVPVVNQAEEAFVAALAARAPASLATMPTGDRASLDAFTRLGDIDEREANGGGLDRVRRYLFASGVIPAGDPLADVELFSAPGEGREAVEIARRILREARRGVRFDDMAIVLRSPQTYAGLLEHALQRAGVPAYFERGTRRPHPTGRAFLALIACAQENLSARRFAEYLSLGQVPKGSQSAGASFPASQDEGFGALAERAGEQAGDEESADVTADAPPSAFRAPWRWERLLAESRVVASSERWERRLNGLMRECELQQRELRRIEPESARLGHLDRKIEDLRSLATFALPIMRELSDWPTVAKWAEWLDLFEALAPRVLARPERVLRVLADLRPMGEVGPVSLDEAARVLTSRLSTIESEPKARRYGCVTIASPAHLRGREFRVVFVPALAERMFPQKPREDPLLLDEARAAVNAALITQDARAELERQQLRLAVGAAGERLYVSFPTVEIGEGRPRVPSLYALEIWRAMTGRVPGATELQQGAARASRATLAWPAPHDSRDAVDALEHDLATLRSLVEVPDANARGRAHYLLQLNDSLQRSVRERFMRSRKPWSRWDGIAQVTERTQPILAEHRLAARVYSLSALQRYATCPYQFLLGAIYRMRPADDLEPLQRMDPLTKGSLFHAVQTEFSRRMQADGRLPVTQEGLLAALDVLDECVREVADQQHDQLAPAIERVWNDEIGAVRRDLRLWVDQIAHASPGWVPIRFEWAFGLKGSPQDEGRDPDSRPEPVLIDGRYFLHGSIDLIEEHASVVADRPVPAAPAAGEGESASGPSLHAVTPVRVLRVTDHKTGRYRGKDNMVIGGGRTLQPVLYSLALETALQRPVVQGRLYYATTDGGFRDVIIPINDVTRRAGLEALEIIDRGIETGFLSPAPEEGACTWCDFRAVCGSAAERRSRRKAQDPMADLTALRRKP